MTGQQHSRRFAILNYFYGLALLLLATYYTAHHGKLFHIAIFAPVFFIKICAVISAIKNWVTVEERICKFLIWFIGICIAAKAYLLFNSDVHIHCIGMLAIIDVLMLTNYIRRSITIKRLIENAKEVMKWKLP